MREKKNFSQRLFISAYMLLVVFSRTTFTTAKSIKAHLYRKIFLQGQINPLNSTEFAFSSDLRRMMLWALMCPLHSILSSMSGLTRREERVSSTDTLFIFSLHRHHRAVKMAALSYISPSLFISFKHWSSTQEGTCFRDYVSVCVSSFLSSC